MVACYPRFNKFFYYFAFFFIAITINSMVSITILSLLLLSDNVSIMDITCLFFIELAGFCVVFIVHVANKECQSAQDSQDSQDPQDSQDSLNSLLD
jgi:hypothetical protein